MKRVAVSVLNYRAAEDTIACVRSLLRAVDKAGQRFGLAIRVSDNGSGRDEGERLREALAGDPRVTLSCAISGSTLWPPDAASIAVSVRVGRSIG